MIVNRKSLLIVTLVVISLGLTGALAWTIYYYQFGPASARHNTDPLAATVNGLNIRQSEVLPYLYEVATAEQLAQWKTLDAIPGDVLQSAVNNLALDKLVVQVAKKESKITDSRDFKAIQEKTNNRLIKSAYLDTLAPTLVNETDIKKQYDVLADSLKGKIEYRARHILLASKKEADIISRSLKEHSFAKLAKLFSLDEASGKRGGDLGYVLPGELNPEFEKAVAKLDVGKVSRPFQTKLGWHVAIVEDRRESKPMKYEQAIPIIRRKLERQRIQAYLEKLLGDADLKVLIKSASN